MYKNFYESENDRRHKFSDKIFKFITVIVSFVGAVLWLIFKFLEIYQNECCYLRCGNFILLVGCSGLMLICVTIFFKVLYGYNEMSPDPNEIKQLITEYKSQTENESAIINAMNESILISYKDAVMNNCIENEKHIKLFELFYKIIFIEMFLLVITFLVEIVV